MENCLITTLNGSVNNQINPPYGYRKFELGTPTDTDRVYVKVINGVKLECADGTFDLYNDAGTTLIQSGLRSYIFTDGSATYYTIEGKGVFYLSDKYEKGFGIYADAITTKRVVIDLDSMNYSSLVTDGYTSDKIILKGTLMVNTLGDVNPLNIDKLSADSDGVIDFTDFVPSKISYMTLRSNANGCIKNLDIEKIGLVAPYARNDNNRPLNLENCSTVYGTLEGFAEAAKTGRTSNTILVYLKGTACTYGGDPITKNYSITYSGSSYTISEIQ